MLEIRIHGRGGQGSVTAAYLLAIAAFAEGYQAQAFPHFGVERRGAPVQAFVRISKKQIRLREHVYHPEVILIQDPTLIGAVDVLQGAHKDTTIIVNSEKSLKELGLPSNYRILTVPATKIALEAMKKPIFNTAMIGAFGGATEILKFESIRKAFCQEFSPELAKINVKAANTAYCFAKPGQKLCQITPQICSITKDDRKKYKVLCQ